MKYLVFCWLLSSVIWAQPDDMRVPDSDKIRSLRVAFITEELDLSSQEAEKFWPVYNEFHKKMRSLQDERRKEMMELRHDELVESDMEQRMQRSFQLEEETLELKRAYHKQFKKVLPVKKVAALYGAEMAFQRRVLEELHKRKLRHERRPDR